MWTGDENAANFSGYRALDCKLFALRGWQAKDVFLPDDYLIKHDFRE